MDNKELIKTYPFLQIEPDNWEYCWLDDLEPGWKKAFGIEMCQEIAAAIKEDECENDFQFLQIKEKFAALRLYATGYGEKTKEVLAKYEELSKYICGYCGKPATQITKVWYYPLCDECVEKYYSRATIPIEKYYHFNSIEEVQKEIQHIKTNFCYGEYWIKV